ncbi:MAG TPA: AbrB/MazE/SpoVT family DNA-binding domain-containing protein [Phycisphaerae bacterium]|jgi:antitoxin MazE|nr:AbrB/MazE/SpoVT family DNA-binding domain-containing protein [Phycisphaerae bacterium]HOB75912.1 AbrB/MazE/SpoVT family DNA-binding domain-containing protein [Phycisphaerae bacterium]HOJ54401.1 AbrB/MazE/SpoVT family DNA-binding domain-containing protein [Phycisphaerae bacterium]HOL26284.1 AbrB/MazE/SpoVT family DNA-binding domain-containing protein [Phycisphaerae bacterium]HPP20808.1 AbrB/MazE/SpoVT family DNA-binding domain-containing protein [Phycisphaerae bacterium]
MTVRVQKWGNSLGVRIPKEIARQAAIREGVELEVSREEDRLILRPVQVPSLKELLAQIKPQDRPELADWGQPVGREVW